MRVLHVTPSYIPAYCYGGPIETVHSLARALLAAGADVKVVTTTANGREDLAISSKEWVNVDDVPVRYFARSLKIDYAPSIGLAQYLRKAAGEFDLIHIASTFSFPALAAGWAARAAKVPYVVSPHGSLQRWSLGQKRWKKAPYWWALEREHLLAAAGIHATSCMEEAEVAEAVPHPGIFVVPNGQAPIVLSDVERHPRRIVFLGRIHPKKGFDVLIPALSRVTQALPDLETVVAGPDSDGEWRRVEALIDRAQPRPNVRYLGPVYGDKRFELLASAAAFVLPSHSENFGMTVVEAMACRTPVVVSRNCPWQSVEDRGAGAWVENTPERVAQALLEILSDPERAKRMGEAGSELAATFAWPRIGRSMLAEYERIVSRRRTRTRSATRSRKAEPGFAETARQLTAGPSRDRMRVLQVVPTFAPAYRYGGPIRSVLHLCQSLQQAACEVDVVTTNSDGPRALDVPTDGWVEHEGLHVRYFPRTIPTDFAVSAGLVGFLRHHISEYDLVHITSTFSFPALVAGAAARAAGIPYVVSPRGSLMQWSLRQKRWKKVPYWLAFEKSHLERAAAIHVTAENEGSELAGILPRAKIILVPNGAEIETIPGEVPRKPRQIVFLGRLHKKKGFDVLVPALAEVAKVLPDAETVIAGPDDDGEWAHVLRLLDSSAPTPRVRYIGPIDGSERFRLLAESAVFVLPSHSENFGNAIVEAMACGTPVVVSRNCPWRAVEERGAGAWVENTPQAVAAALLKILLDPVRAAAMGCAGRELASSYSWPAIGRAMAESYRTIIDQCR